MVDVDPGAAGQTVTVTVGSTGYSGLSFQAGPGQTSQASTTVHVIPPDAFNVFYGAYIPVDNVAGPTLCSALVPLIYMGDAGRGTYRASESILAIPDVHGQTGFTQATGQTRNYGAGSRANGVTLSELDEDGIAFDCRLWNNAGQATPNFSYSSGYPGPHQVAEQFSGATSNPLENSLAAIQWNMIVTLDDTSPQGPTATLNYTHTCYPAHQVSVNGYTIYSYVPPSNSISYIFYCLTFPTNYTSLTGTVGATVVPAAPN